MKPSALYLERLATEELTRDAQQVRVIEIFDQVHTALNARQDAAWWKQWLPGQRPKIRGIYLWGGVGVGKTMLMDLFYESYSSTRKQRWHFHEFMQQVHLELKQLQGQSDPLTKLAKKIAQDTDLLCLDEFLVNDIADAMILSNFLKALYDYDVVLMTTSNTEPKNLYLHGLQRARFLPAIHHLEEHHHVLHLKSTHDYRRQFQTLDTLYFSPSGDDADQELKSCFTLLADGELVQTNDLVVKGRIVKARCHTNRLVWFDFDQLCVIPRSQQDYLDLARRFEIFFLSNIPVFDPTDTSSILYFIYLIDVLYDKHRLVFLSSELPIEALLTSGPKFPEFQRTLSRLNEMKSEAYRQV